MALAEDIIFADPALQSAFFDHRRLVPKSGHEPFLNIDCYDLAVLFVAFMHAREIQDAERLQRLIRSRWFTARAQCDGWLIEMPCGYDDGCQHVQAFARKPADFRIDFRARAHLWYIYAQRPPPPWV